MFWPLAIQPKQSMDVMAGGGTIVDSSQTENRAGLGPMQPETNGGIIIKEFLVVPPGWFEIKTIGCKMVPFRGPWWALDETLGIYMGSC